MMGKRTYLPNQVINDKDLPFNLEITSGLTVYVRGGSNGQMIKAETLYLKFKKWLVVNYSGFIITIKGYDQKKKTFIYTITEEV